MTQSKRSEENSMDSLIDQFTSGKDFPESSFPELASEVRQRIIDTVSENGGHLASNLGVVELTIALLAKFNPQKDRIIWDVSHQCYAWKILTGRNEKFSTLRKHCGISGFLKHAESKCDAFDAGHAGTAISAALGMAAARDAKKGDEHIVAVVGDGAFANGLSLEALNNVASSTKKLIVILNDNEMSISPNVGALSRYFGKLLVNRRYNQVKTKVETLATKLHLTILLTAYRKIRSMLKRLFVKNGMVEALGFRYVGPIDGHDFTSLANAITLAKNYEHPILLHVSTQKGRGYEPAETEPWKWHGVSPFNKETGTAKKPAQRDFSAAFSDSITNLARSNNSIAAITAGMRSGTGLDAFASEFPDRFFDVGICEEHAATFAAGLAASGMHPVVALYSTFAQRAIDNIFHDICLQNLPVVFCLDRAGIVGADGPTHHGIFDIALLRSMPNITIMQPRDEASLVQDLSFAIKHKGPSVIRYPRGSIGKNIKAIEKASAISFNAEILKVPVAGTGKKHETKTCWIWALGDFVPEALEVAEMLENNGIPTGVVDPRFITPLDTELLFKQADNGAIFVTMENGVLGGGFGSSVLETISSSGRTNTVLRFGWPTEIIPHGTVSELLKEFDLDADSVAGIITSKIKAGEA